MNERARMITGAHRSAVIAFVVLASAAPALRAQDSASVGANTQCVAAIGPDAGDTTTSTMRAPRRDTLAARADASGHPALRLVASAYVDEIRFAKQPVICVRLNGDAQLDKVRVTGRRNLSSPVVAGTSYRDVYVAVEILGHLNAACIASRITGAPIDSGSAAARALCASAEATRPTTPPLDKERR